jgi:hypothetical protein
VRGVTYHGKRRTPGILSDSAGETDRRFLDADDDIRARDERAPGTKRADRLARSGSRRPNDTPQACLRFTKQYAPLEKKASHAIRAGLPLL